ncbi:MAG TPA: CAP domain-containing protein [Planctomycetota bacterium]|nr:CAP domain-containing protein [Planctomycetota bacterium]
MAVVAVGALLAVGSHLLQGGVRSELNSIARHRQGGQLARAAEAIERLRTEWALATDDRLQRLEMEHQALREVEMAKERLEKAILESEAKKGYTFWKGKLEKLKEEGEGSEQVAAGCVLAGLNELMLRRPKPVIAPLSPDAPLPEDPADATTQPSTRPQPSVTQPPVTQPPVIKESAKAVPPTPLSAPVRPVVDRTAANVAEARRLAGQGLFAQAIALLQAAQGDAENAEAAARAREQLAELRKQAKVAMQAVIDEARTVGATKPAEGVSVLAKARHRFPASPEFGALAEELAKAEAVVAAAARLAAAKVQPGKGDEAALIASLATVRVKMESVRAAEARAAFVETAGLLREAAALVGEKDKDFAERLLRRAEEADLQAAWHESIAAVLGTGRRLTTTSKAGSVELCSTEGPVLLANAAEGQKRLTWNDIPADGVHALAEQSGAGGRAVLGASTLLYKKGDKDRAEAWLAKALRADASLKTAIDRVLASGRGEPIDALGYQLGKSGFVSGRSIEVEKQAQKLGARLAAALRDKNPGPRDAIVTEARAAGPEAVAVMVAACRKEFGQQIEKLQTSGLRKQVERLAEQRVLLDQARKHARDLIYDEVKYFYPFKPPAVSGQRYAEYLEVQAEVERRTDALRTLWQDQRLRVRVPAGLRADLDRLDWVARVLADSGELDRQSLAQAEWARALPAGDSIGIADYCTSAAERAELEQWRHIEAYNAVIGKQVSSAVREQLKITNDYRAMFRHRPLALVRAVCDAAQSHADEMSRLGYFNHMSPTPGRVTPYDRMRLAGYNFGVSENIALCDGAQSAHNQWLTSAGHHRNLLDPGNREVGIGADGRNWVQNFGSGNAHEVDEAWAASRGATSR